MSSSDTAQRETYALRLPTSPDALISVYDGWLNLCWHGTGGTVEELELERGLYTVRVEVNNAIEEQLVRLDQPRDVSSLKPARYTAAPVQGSAISHEYYGDPAQKISIKPTRQPLTPGQADAELFVFIRSIAKESAPPSARSMAAKLYVCNAAGERIANFTSDPVRSSDKAGFIAFTAPAQHGLYRLRYAGNPERELPIYLFPHYQTQVFILHKDRLLPEGARIFMSRLGTGFNPLGHLERAADEALDAVMNGAERVPHGLIDVALQVTENPIFQLTAAYLCTRQLQAERRQSDAGSDTLHKLDGLLHTLTQVIPDSPDVRALKLMRAELCGERLALEFTTPPMFRSGFAAVLRAENEKPGKVVVEDSLVEQVLTGLYADSPWTTWQPLARDAHSPSATKGQYWGFTDFVERGDGDDGGEDTDTGRATTRRGDGDDDGDDTPRTLPPIPLRGGDGDGDGDGVHRPSRGTAPRLGSGAGRSPKDFAAKKPAAPTPEDARLSWIQSAFLDLLESELARLKRAGRPEDVPQLSIADVARQTGTTARTVQREVEKLDMLNSRQRSKALSGEWAPVVAIFRRRSDLRFRNMLA